MNTANNKRRKESRDHIEKAFIRLLQDRRLEEVRVTEICSEADVNRTTFYANYEDIYDLAEKVQIRLEEEVVELYREEHEQEQIDYNFLKLFYHIKENPLFYRTYFKLNAGKRLRFVGYRVEDAVKRFDNRYIEYHMDFFANGLNAVLNRWLDNDCRETPEEIKSIIEAEYLSPYRG